MKKVNTVIIGCGQIAGAKDKLNSSQIRTHAKAYTCNKFTNIVGVCDTDIKKAKFFAKKWKIKYYSNSIRKVVCNTKPSLVSVCTPTNTHKKTIETLAKLGIKQIWLEKPAAASLKELKEIAKITKKYKIKIWINYFRLYEPEIGKLKKEIMGIKPIQLVNCLYTKGLKNNGSHLLSLLHFLLDKKYDVRNKINHNNKFYPGYSFQLFNKTYKINIELLNEDAFEIFEIDILGKNGRLILRNQSRNLHIYKVKKNIFTKGYKNLQLAKKKEIDLDLSFGKVLDHILNGKNNWSLEKEMNIELLINKVLKI